MDNASFRTLLSNQSSSTNSAANNSARKRQTFGGRPRGNASRNLASSYARSLFEQQTSKKPSNTDSSEPPRKKVKSNSAPKGSRFAKGYVDRSLERRGQEGSDGDEEGGLGEKQKKLSELEKLLKDEEIDRETFEKRRDELGIGGDIRSTHLVKGLDFKLLERIKRGEDVSAALEGKGEEGAEDKEDGKGAEELDDELEKMLEKEVGPVAAQKETEHRQKDSAEEAPREVLSRDEILRRLKERRKNPSVGEDNVSALQASTRSSVADSRFTKITSSKKPPKQKFTETVNGRRREVLVITAKDGSTKRKTRWIDPEPDESAPATETRELLGGDLDAGIIARQKEYQEEQDRLAQEAEAADVDIFGDVGEYDPLKDLDNESGSEEEGERKDRSTEGAATDQNVAARSRNYFASGNDDKAEEKLDPKQDPTILAALKKAAQMRRGGDEVEQRNDDDDMVDPEALAKRAAFMKAQKERDRQDAQDIDMGFGGDRYDDDDDDGPIYNDLGDEDDGKGRSGKAPRKRAPKKKKGDKNNARDVLSVIEGRKK